ncbi:hypothetical protein GCM10007902_03970 [Dyella nitratireducens]|nr:hypothetical protein GCM10007902_03970 [Dyella nitratireducens]
MMFRTYAVPIGMVLPDVIPAKAGIHRQYEAWIPAFAGMTVRYYETSPDNGGPSPG